MIAKISRGNSKLGTVANISLPPVKTCKLTALRNGKVRFVAPPCAKLCYALKSERMYQATRDMRAHNLRAFQRTPKEYFDSIALESGREAFFRWHVSGDVVDMRYLLGIVSVSQQNPQTKYLWPRLEMINPYDLPIAFMVPKDGSEDRLDGTEIACPGNCETCGMCWNLPVLKRNVAFHQH